jgi:hypothetical protein
MLLPVLAFAAVQLGARPADLVRPDEEAAYATQLAKTADRIVSQRATAPCPADAKVASLGAGYIGTAAEMLHPQATDPVSPEARVFREHVRIEGCGAQARVDNVMTVRQKAGGWWMSVSAPGDTIASPGLIQDVLRMSVALATAGRPPATGCADGQRVFLLLDTKLVGPPPSHAPGTVATWQERWRQTSCGEDRSVLVTFTSAADGGTDFQVQPAWSAGNPRS